MHGGIGCHATSKVAELSYNPGYLIMLALFSPVCPVRGVRPVFPVRPVCPNIIRISWISTFCGYYPHFVDIFAFRGYYPHIVHIVDIYVFHGYYFYLSRYNILSS